MPAKEIAGIHMAFRLYVMLPEPGWKHIRLAERETPEGNAAFREYPDRYVEMFVN